jgi:hypothetical protein
MKTFKGHLEETRFEKSVLSQLAPWLTSWLDKKIDKQQFQAAVKFWLKLRKKNPGQARANLIKTSRIFDVDVRALDQFFQSMVDKGIMPAHLTNYPRMFKAEELSDEERAGDEGTDKLVKRYKKDTPGEK